MINRNRRGSYYATVALALPVLIGFTAMGVDWGSIAVARNQVQTAADSAALAAVSSMDDRGVGRTRAAAYAAAVQVNGKPAVVHASDVEYGHWTGAQFLVDANGDGFADTDASKKVNCAKAVASVDIELPFTSTFRKLLGDNQAGTLTVRQVAGASPNATPGRAPDTVLVLDVTYSMAGVGEYDAESMAAQELVSCVKTHSTGSSRAAVTKFTNVDRLGLVLSDYATYYDDLMQATSRSSVSVGGVYGIAGCDRGDDPACSGYTNQAAGLAGARYILEEASTPADVQQAVVLFSDGAPYGGNGEDACNPANYTEPGLMWNEVSAPTIQDRCNSMTERECSVHDHKSYSTVGPAGHTVAAVTGHAHATEASCIAHASCSNLAYTTKATCEAVAGVCSNSKYTTEATCEASGKCSNSAYTTRATCEAVGACNHGSYSSEATCEAAGTCSNSKYTTEATCEAAGSCSGGSYTDKASCESHGSCAGSGKSSHRTPLDTSVLCVNNDIAGHTHTFTPYTYTAGTETWTLNTWSAGTENWTAGTWTPNVWSTHTWGPPFDVPNDSSGAYGFPHYLTEWAYSEKALLLANGAARVGAGMGDLTIYTVYYSETPDADEIAFMESLATNPSKAYDVSDIADIPGIFHEICEATQTGDPGLLF